MSFFEDNIFEVLSKYDLDEDLAPEINGEAVLYEDAEFSKTPAEADAYRTEAEEVLGFELTGNQVQYLATSWSEFYHNAKDCEDIRELIIKKMNRNPGTQLTNRQQEAMDNFNNANTSTTYIDADDDIDYYEDNPDALHPVFNADTKIDTSEPADGKIPPSSMFNQPVQSQDAMGSSENANINAIDDFTRMANEQVLGNDIDDDIDPQEINKILNKE